MFAAFVEDGHAGSKKAILANVHDQILYAVDDFRIVYEFDVITGQPGKETTPEGHYILDYKNLHSEYYKCIHISYPNAQDRASARERGVDPGGDIMIHGQASGYEGFSVLFSSLTGPMDASH